MFPNDISGLWGLLNRDRDPSNHILTPGLKKRKEVMHNFLFERDRISYLLISLGVVKSNNSCIGESHRQSDVQVIPIETINFIIFDTVLKLFNPLFKIVECFL